MSCEYCKQTLYIKEIRTAPFSTQNVKIQEQELVDIAGVTPSLLDKPLEYKEYYPISYFFCPMCGAHVTQAEPLTLGKLEERAGEPIWLVCKPWQGYAFWHQAIREKGFYFQTPENERSYIFRHTEDYGKTWLAYDREPEEVEKTWEN